MAPWRLLGGLWRPWGAWGRPRRIFEKFGELFGVPSGGPKSVKKALKKKLKSNIAFDAHFGPSGAPLGHFLGSFWRYFWVLFWSQRREAGFLKIVLPLEREHDFRGSRGSKKQEKGIRKRYPTGTGLQERLGRLLGSILSDFGSHFGSQNRSKTESENELKFVWFSRGPKGRRVSLTGAPPGYSRTAGEG